MNPLVAVVAQTTTKPISRRLNLFRMSNGADILGVAEISDIIICFVCWWDSKSEKHVFFLR
jgi:hypothetical protein